MFGLATMTATGCSPIVQCMAKTPSRSQGRAVVYGAAFSVYVQAVRLVLEEKGVDYELHEVDPFGPGGPPADHLERHPFGKIPAFEDGRVRLFESEAIARYIDDAYPGPALQPVDPVARAHMSQTISVLHSYAYPTWVRTVYIERVSKPRRGAEPDEAAIMQAMPRVRTCARIIAQAMGDGPFLAAETPTLADCFAAPMLACLMEAPEGASVLAKVPTLSAWWDRMRARETIQRIVV